MTDFSDDSLAAAKEEEFLYHLEDGLDLLRAGRVADAKKQFERALVVKPGSEQALNLFGLSLHGLGELDEANKVFQNLIHENPVDASLRLNLAMVMLKKHDLVGAKSELEVVLDLNPDHSRAATYMGLVMEKTNCFSDASLWYERAGNEERASQMRSRAGTEESVASLPGADDSPVDETKEFVPALRMPLAPGPEPSQTLDEDVDDEKNNISEEPADELADLPSLDDDESNSELAGQPSLDDDEKSNDELADLPSLDDDDDKNDFADEPADLPSFNGDATNDFGDEPGLDEDTDLSPPASFVAFSTLEDDDDDDEADLSELDDVPSLEDDYLDLEPPSLHDEDVVAHDFADEEAVVTAPSLPSFASAASYDDDEGEKELPSSEDDALDLEPPSLEELETPAPVSGMDEAIPETEFTFGETNNEQYFSGLNESVDEDEDENEENEENDDFPHPPPTDSGADESLSSSWEDSAIDEDHPVLSTDEPDERSGFDGEPGDGGLSAVSLENMAEAKEGSEEMALPPDVEAAALTAATRDAMQRPAEVPPAESADAARSASLGFTLEFDAEGAASGANKELPSAESMLAVEDTPSDASDFGEAELVEPDAGDASSAADGAKASFENEAKSAGHSLSSSVDEPAEPNSDKQLEPHVEQIRPQQVDPKQGDSNMAPSITPKNLHDFGTSMDAHNRRKDCHMRANGAVVLPVDEVLYVRSDLLASLSGQFEIEPCNRRYRGRRTDTLFGGENAPMIALMGNGMCILDPGELEMTVLDLDNEELYLLEDSLISFSSGLVWENGRLPADEGNDLDIVHLRGDGNVVFGTRYPLRAYLVSEGNPLTLRTERLIGWKGQVVPYRGKLVGLPDSAHRPSIVRFEGDGLVVAR
ncbi:MAG: tetratricopeptide repeat protein [Deltaproteobacteria bacterium]|nr:tetratricopeptide repeat protein [Deltaproteobacteria bacterium]